MEVESFGDALGTSILYEHLARVVSRRLNLYIHRIRGFEERGWRRWWAGLRRAVDPLLSPQELQSQTLCRVCQIGAQRTRDDLKWLLNSFLDPSSDWRDQYLRSGRLCLAHLKQAFDMAGSSQREAVHFLAADAREYLSQLARDLGSYADKHAWDRRNEGMTEAESNSWIDALNFFGGNSPENMELKKPVGHAQKGKSNNVNG